MFHDETGHRALRSKSLSRLDVSRLTILLVPLLSTLIALPTQAFYQIKDGSSGPAVAPAAPLSFSPADLPAWQDLKTFEADALKSKAVLSLMDWVRHTEAQATPSEPYNRRRQFGTWRKPDDQSCLDIRGLVLQRDSQSPVVTRQSRDHCVVVSGTWADPYAGATTSSASTIDIDHVVPLKNAYDNGGWRWAADKRCHYFNFIENPQHLLAVSQTENSAKGDSSPADYMPPVRSYQCTYLKYWLSIKLIWGLEMTDREADSIRDHVQQLGCDQNDLVLNATDLARFRQQIGQTPSMCNMAAIASTQNQDTQE